MSVLVDTSVWSLAFRKAGPADHPKVRQLTALLDEDQSVVLTGLILQEILQAFRSDSTFRELSDYLESFPLLPLNRSEYVAAARLHRACASKGVSASTSDCQIAIAAITLPCPLLTTDKDFDHIALLSDLQLM